MQSFHLIEFSKKYQAILTFTNHNVADLFYRKNGDRFYYVPGKLGPLLWLYILLIVIYLKSLHICSGYHNIPARQGTCWSLSSSTQLLCNSTINIKS